MSSPLIEISDLSKEYFGIPALKKVSCVLNRGEIKGILGENGAGKSTFMKCLSGIETRTEGDVLINGIRYSPDSPHDAMEKGIVLVHQELNLCEDLTVFENIWLGIDEKLLWRFDNEAARRSVTKNFLDELGAECLLDTTVHELAIGEKQLVEIIKALVREPEILILDEPTSSLGDKEAQKVLSLVKRLSTEGVGIFYISHKMDEIKALSHSVLVLRDGEKVFEGDAQTSHELLYEHIARRKKKETPPTSKKHLGSSAPRISLSTGLTQQSVELPLGAIIGIVGLGGAGKTSLLEELAGYWTPASTFHPRLSSEATSRLTTALVPDDRKKKGLILQWNINDNIALSNSNARWNEVINNNEELSVTTEIISTHAIKARGPESVVQYLSGGNQQKVLIAKALLKKPQILLLDEPTRGIDVGAKEHIYEKMRSYVEDGKHAVLFSTSELEEALQIANVLVVLKDKKIVGVISKEEEFWDAGYIVTIM